MELGECSVIGCGEPAVKVVGRRYLPALQALKLRVNPRVREFPLCKKHYKMAREALKELSR